MVLEEGQLFIRNFHEVAKHYISEIYVPPIASNDG